MRKSAPIEVVVYYPKTKEGWDELGKRVATAHAQHMLFCSDQVRSDAEAVLSVGLFVLHKSFEMRLTKLLVVGSQYVILWHCITRKTVPLFAERAYRNRPDGAAEKAF